MLPILKGWFSGDGYGHHVLPATPLSFNRVNEGRPPSSSAPLFCLPEEVLGLILEWVEPSSLPYLAMVNWDCRQLARSRQFASVTIDDSPAKAPILLCLASEANFRLNNGGKTLKPSLGVCIRRLTFAYSPCHNWSQVMSQLDREERSRKEAAEYHYYYRVYLIFIEAILLVNGTLPHLELLNWTESVILPQSLYQALSRSSIKHLKLLRPRVGADFEIAIPSSRIGWPLRSLYLELMKSGGQTKNSQTFLLCNSIVRQCAASLELLIWAGDINDFERNEPPIEEVVLDVPAFPNLRILDLGIDCKPSTSVLVGLLQATIRRLQAPVDQPYMRNGFGNRGQIASLETFIWNEPHLSEQSAIGFLEANMQIKNLMLPCTASSEFLCHRVLPLISSSFWRLESLYLQWPEAKTTIPAGALRLIGIMTTLRRLHLSAGCRFGWRHDWLIDHEELRRYLGNLQGSKKLAFSRDTYPLRFDYPEAIIDSERGGLYYELRTILVTSNIRLGISEKKAWEKRHARMIRAEAVKYAELLPHLEWIYFGQIPMAAITVDFIEQRQIEQLRDRQPDSCWRELKEMFGWKDMLTECH